MKRNRRYNKWGYAYANGFVVLAEGLDMFRLRLLTLAGTRTGQAICPLRKELWLAGCLGVEPREMGSLWLRASTDLHEMNCGNKEGAIMRKLCKAIIFYPTGIMEDKKFWEELICLLSLHKSFT
jgi:hypothetical protein